MSQEQTKGMSQYFYRASAADFMNIPGSPVAYWVTESIVSSFSKSPGFNQFGETLQGMTTCDNEFYLRLWQEINYLSVKLDANNRQDAKNSGMKWFPYTKGGEMRKWYGNNEYLVNWENDGYVLRTRKHPEKDKVWAHNFNLDHIFREGASYSSLSSGTFACRYTPTGYLFDQKGSMIFFDSLNINLGIGLFNSCITAKFLEYLCPTLDFNPGALLKIPVQELLNFEIVIDKNVELLISISKNDWDSYESSWDFTEFPLLYNHVHQSLLTDNYRDTRANWLKMTKEMQHLEEENNRLFIDAYGLQDVLTPVVPLEEITLTCNPYYRYGSNRSTGELESLLQCDTLRELVSYAIGCMMGRYSIDKPGLILASQGETIEDYLKQIPSPRFMPDDDAILPLTDQEWFADDATNRFREFVRVVWGDEHLQENLDFVAESLCLHAIKPKRGESALDTIRRYLSTQFYKDHMRTYKKRPIYWLFSSGKHKAFECLVYLHRYNEGTLARMRTEYVIPLSSKLAAYADNLEQDKAASASAAETKRLEKEISTLHKQQAELAEFDEKLRHYADQRISLDLDDGVKVNYGKFGDLLASVKEITGKAPS